MAPAGTPLAEAPPASQDLVAPTAEAFAKAAPQGEVQRTETRPGAAPVPPLWLLLLATFGILLIGLSWYLDRYTRRNFRSRFLEK